MAEPWYRLVDVDALDSPCLVVHPRRVAENIHRMVSMVDDPSRLRPHIKTHKTAEGVRMMMQAGIGKFKCATIAEAELLGICGAPDVLLAYQPHGPKARRLAALGKAYPGTQYACLTDNAASARGMSRIFAEEGLRVPVYLDIDIGMHRSGMAPDPAKAVELFAECLSMDGILPVGLHAYDGHHRDPDFTRRKAACDEGFQSIDILRTRITEVAGVRSVVIVGGSPTFPIHAARPDVECSPGTSIFWDACYAGLCPEQPFEPAVALVARVLSLPTPTRVCIDLGHKSVAAENDIAHRVVFPDAPDLRPVSQSEEHLVAEAPEGHGYRPGDVLYGIPYHVCPTVALYDSLPVAVEGRVKGAWKVVARDRSIGN
jgi:D-serine deaminase-like pyridoxal phosphate-dependent protein